MKKKELLEKIKSFDDDSDVVFVTDNRDLVRLDDEGIDIDQAVEVNNGIQKVIALME